MADIFVILLELKFYWLLVYANILLSSYKNITVFWNYEGFQT